MDTRDLQNKLLEFTATLPDGVRQSFKSRGDFDVVLALGEIGEKYELLINEIHWLYETVRRVLAGEDSSAGMVAFISQDERIEEDNRAKIPAIAQEIQTKIFDVVLPILKQAGMPVREVRVPQPSVGVERLAVSTQGTKHSLASLHSPALSSASSSVIPPSLSELNANRYPPAGGLIAPLDERHLRALLRIAAGTNYSETQLREAFADLPEGLKRAITTVDTANAIQEIAKRFLLHIDQMAALASETGLVLLGLTHPRDFVKNLATRLRISEARALEIAREVSEQILGKVREALRTLHQGVSNTESRISKNQEQDSQKKEKVNTELNANRYPPDGGLTASSTPYSAEVKWGGEMEHETWNREQAEKGKKEELTREEVLKGIESPSGTGETKLKTSNLKLETRVGPTGWKAPGSTYQSTNDTNQRMAANEKKIPPPSGARPTGTTQSFGRTPFNSKGRIPAPPTAPVAPLVSDYASPKKGEGDSDFLEEKLAGPTGAAHTEQRYTIDPYREPLK